MSYGKITEYDGNTGNITDINGDNYLLLRHELKDNTLKENDYVVFKPENYDTVEVNEKVARFVKRLDKKTIRR